MRVQRTYYTASTSLYCGVYTDVFKQLFCLYDNYFYNYSYGVV